MRQVLQNEPSADGNRPLILRFLNNNDTGERFASQHGLPTAKLAATLLFTLPGLPLIYNGDEIAAEFRPYDEGPPLRWDDEHPLVLHYGKLALLRADTAALRSRELRLLETKQDGAILAFLRPDNEDVLVLLNFSDTKQRVQADDAQSEETLSRFKDAKNLLGGDISTEGQAFVLDPKEALVLVTAESSQAR